MMSDNPDNLYPYPKVTNTTYRADIDGLRAIAIIIVVLFHYFPESVGAGFIGVDIFFVISGYLISKNILEDCKAGRFSFLNFYSRRIRRIFPALIVVLLACIVAGRYILFPDEFSRLVIHTLAGSTFSSNFILLSESGYFDSASISKPLLHLWSLGIEEQFYIFFPAIIWVIYKLKFNVLYFLLTGVIISFSLNIATVQANPVLDFYSPHTRAWELLAGSIIGYFSVYSARPVMALKGPLNHFISMLGLALLAIGIFFIEPSKPFPGWAGLLPVLSATLLIASGRDAIINKRLLANKLMVWIGLISFPLYLWHWPIFSFLNIVYSGPPPTAELWIGIFVSICLSILTYRIVELPIRFGPGKRKVPLLIISLVIVVAFSYFLDYTNSRSQFKKAAIYDLNIDALGDVKLNQGIGKKDQPTTDSSKPSVESTTSPSSVFLSNNASKGSTFKHQSFTSESTGGDVHDAFFNFLSKNYYQCSNQIILKNSELYKGHKRCFQSKNNDVVDIALIGDSHAEHLFIGLAQAMPKFNIAYYIRSDLPFTDNPKFAEIFSEIKGNPALKKVIFSALWSRRIGDLGGDVNATNKFNVLFEFFKDSGKKVYITDNIPIFTYEPVHCSQERVISALPRNCEIQKADADIKSKRFRFALENSLSINPDIYYIGIEKYICPDFKCRMNHENKILYRDNRHLSVYGSIYLGRFILRENPFLNE